MPPMTAVLGGCRLKVGLQLEMWRGYISNKGFFFGFFLRQVRQSYPTGASRQRLELERCEEIVKKLMKYRYSWPFR